MVCAGTDRVPFQALLYLGDSFCKVGEEMEVNLMALVLCWLNLSKGTISLFEEL